MNSLYFDWDKNKAAENKKKHNITFDEAKTVFYDTNARMIHDPEHSDDEDRFVLLGLSSSLRMLIVCHCYRKNDSIIRIISARKANKQEQKQYRSFLL